MESVPENAEANHRFEEVVIFYNQKSTSGQTSYENVKMRLGSKVEVRGGTIPVRYYETSEEAEATEETFIEQVDPDKSTFIGFSGGDGTARQFVQFLAGSNYDEAALAAVGGGSGGNILRSTVPKDYRATPDCLVVLGDVEQFRPIECDFILPDGTNHTLFAASILGGPATHNMIYPVNHESHKGKSLREWHIGQLALGKYLVDGPEMFSGLLKSRGFESRQSDGRYLESAERAYINLPRIAEMFNFAEVSVTGPIHKVDMATRFNLIRAIWTQIKTGESHGKVMPGADTFTVMSDLAFQIDGEDSIEDSRIPLPYTKDKDGKDRKLLIWPAGTKVEVRQSGKVVPLVTLKN